MYQVPIKINKGYKPSAPVAPASRSGGSIFDLALGFDQLTKLIKEVDTLRTKAEAMIAEETRKAEEAIAKIHQTVAKKEAEANARIQSIKIEHQGIPGKDAPPVDEKAIEDRIASRIRQPKDGETPVVDLEKLAKKAAKLIPPPKNGKDAVINKKEIVDEVVKEIKENLKVEHIPGLKGEIDSYRNQLAGKSYGRDTWARGGGDTVVAGTGVTITTNSNGNKVITASGGTDVFNEVVSGSGTTFTLANTPTAGTVRIVAGRNRLYPTTDYTISGATITTVLSWNAGDLLADYKY